MSTRYAALVLALSLVACSTVMAQGHLEPEDGALNKADRQWTYTKTLRDVLMKDASSYHLARMICLPSFQPEWVVTLVREDGGGDVADTYYIETIVVNKKLFNLKDSEAATVSRSRAVVDRETAESLNIAWRMMLRTTRYPKEHRLGADGVEYHFSRSVPVFKNGRPDPFAGWEQGKIWTPEEGSACRELTSLAEDLKAFSLARPDEREKFRTEIRLKADRLKARLSVASRVPR